jgi:hypothetical protein
MASTPWEVNVNIGSRLACDFSLSDHGKDGVLITVFIPVVFLKESSD